MHYISTENILLIGSTLLMAGVLMGKTSYRIGILHFCHSNSFTGERLSRRVPMRYISRQ